MLLCGPRIRWGLVIHFNGCGPSRCVHQQNNRRFVKPLLFFILEKQPSLASAQNIEETHTGGLPCILVSTGQTVPIAGNGAVRCRGGVFTAIRCSLPQVMV